MSLRVDRLALKTALAKVKPVIRAGPLGILRRVLLSSRPDASGLTISATDLRCSVAVEIARQGSAEALEAVVDHGRLAEVCAAEWTEELELGVGEDGRLDVVGGARTRLACFPVDESPTVLPPPEGGEWMELRAGVVEAISRVAPWCTGEMEKRHVSVQARFVWVFGIKVAEESVLGICGAGEHACLCLYLPPFLGEPAREHLLNREGAECLALGKDGAGLVVGLAGGEGIEALDGERRHWFRGGGWWASETKGETDRADIRTFLEHRSVEGFGMRELSAVKEIIRALGAAPRGVAGIGSGTRGLLKLVPASPSGCHCYLTGAEVSWSAEMAADLPAFKTYEVAALVGILRELYRCAGVDGAVEAGMFQKDGLRLEVEGRALALLTGVRE